MRVPTYNQEQITSEDGKPSDGFSLLLTQLLQGLQLGISDDGYAIPSVSSEPDSAGTGYTQLGVLEATYLTNVVNDESQNVIPGVRPGTIIFDPYELNGGVVGPPRVPQGQLKVLLNDGTFHAIVNL
jgi:hypothetical protein